MAKQPNLVFVFSDRQRFDTLQAYGNDYVKAPNLNALAKESIVFKNAYVTQAVCAPARASIMTGLYPHAAGMPRNKLVMPDEIQTIANMVSNDYKKAYFGKWHLGNEVINQRGFDEWASGMETLREEYTEEEYLELDTSYHEFLVGNGYEPDEELLGRKIFSDSMRAALPAEFQMASFFANRAEAFIKENKDNPFVMYVSFLEPHPPWTGPYDGIHDPKEVPIEPTFLKRPDGHSLFSRVRSDFFMQSDLHTPDDVDDAEWEKGREEYNGLDKAIGRQFDLKNPDSWKQIRANYYGNITLVDDAVGKILNALDEANIAQDTIFIFTSEHGDLVGTHGMMEMRTFYEEAAKVPLIIRAPMHNKEPKLVEGNFGQIDLIPTLLDLLGQDIPEHVQGTTKADVIKGKSDLSNNEVFMEHNGIGDRNLGTPVINMLNNMQWRSIVTSDRWKLNLCATDQCELFNLNDDPYEEVNLFNKPEHKDRIRIMAAKIRMWQHETGDHAPLPDV
tara:strand:+ start:1 stop:1512 length:1512 start_codon:yes stop_codon:yes gene_type:complete